MPSLLSLSPQRFWLTQSPQEMSTGGMEREEEGEENKGDLRWVTCKSMGMVWGSGEVGRKECSEGEVQVSGIPPPDEHHHFPPPGTSTTQKTCLKKKEKKGLFWLQGEAGEGEGDTYTDWDVLNRLLSYLRLTPQAAPELDGWARPVCWAANLEWRWHEWNKEKYSE